MKITSDNNKKDTRVLTNYYFKKILIIMGGLFFIAITISGLTNEASAVSNWAFEIAVLILTFLFLFIPFFIILNLVINSGSTFSKNTVNTFAFSENGFAVNTVENEKTLVTAIYDYSLIKKFKQTKHYFLIYVLRNRGYGLSKINMTNEEIIKLTILLNKIIEDNKKAGN